MFVFVSFFFKEENVNLCFASFVSQQRNIVQLQNCIKRNIIIQQHIDWYASTYSSRFVKLTFI